MMRPCSVGALLRLLLCAATVPGSLASMKHPVHGRNIHSRPHNVTDSLYHLLDNTDKYKDNIVPLTYRKSTAERIRRDKEAAKAAAAAAAADLVDADGTTTSVPAPKHGGAAGSDRGDTGSNSAEVPSAERQLLLDDWLTWEDAADDGQVGPLRITYVTEFWDQGAAMLEATEHCASEGQFVRPSLMTSTTVGGTGAITCMEDDVVDEFKVFVVKKRLDWVRQYVVLTTSVCKPCCWPCVAQEPPPPCVCMCARAHTRSRSHARVRVSVFAHLSPKTESSGMPPIRSK